MTPDDFVVSQSGVLVWKSPHLHPLLRGGNTDHPDLVRKAREVFAKGSVRGLPRICSENSEDACTWFYFSPLMGEPVRKVRVLARLFREAFPNQVGAEVFQALPLAELHFWQGRKTPSFSLDPPPSRTVPEGATEVDLIVTVGKEAVLFIEAKYMSGASVSTKHDKNRDQVIRNLDVGSWFATGRFKRFYLLLLQYGDHPTNSEEIVSRYKLNPRIIRERLPYRRDLADGDINRLSKSVGFVRWPNPLSWGRVLLSDSN